MFVIVLLGAGCTSSPPEVASATSDSANGSPVESSAEDTSSCESPLVVDVVPIGMNQIAHESDAIVIGVVDAVGSPDPGPAREFEGDPGTTFRTVSMSVQHSLHGDHVAGDAITFVIAGSGIPDGCGRWGTVDLEQLAGRFDTGATYLVALAEGPYLFSTFGSPSTVTGLTSADYRSQWRLSGDAAISFDPARSATRDDLVRRINLELARGPLAPDAAPVDQSFDDVRSRDQLRRPRAAPTVVVGGFDTFAEPDDAGHQIDCRPAPFPHTIVADFAADALSSTTLLDAVAFWYDSTVPIPVVVATRPIDDVAVTEMYGPPIVTGHRALLVEETGHPYAVATVLESDAGRYVSSTITFCDDPTADVGP